MLAMTVGQTIFTLLGMCIGVIAFMAFVVVFIPVMAYLSERVEEWLNDR